MLVNHKTETYNWTCTSVAEDDRYAHEYFYPPIVSREEWEQVQKILQTKIRPYRGHQRKHRYAGLLTCESSTIKKRPAIHAQIRALTAELDRLEQEVDEIIMEQLQAN